MSEEQKKLDEVSTSDEPEAKVSQWDKNDPKLRRYQQISSSIAATLVIGSFLLPYLVICAVLLQFVFMAWYLYKWRRDEHYLLLCFKQHMFLVMAATSFLQTAIFVTVAGHVPHIQPLAFVWIVVGCCWIGLAVYAAYARDRALDERITRVADAVSNLSMLSSTQTKIIDVLSTMADTQHSLAECQGLMGKGNEAHAKLIGLLQTQIAALTADKPKKRGKKKDLPADPPLFP